MRQHHCLALSLALSVAAAGAVEEQFVLSAADASGESCAPISDVAFDELVGDPVSAYGIATYGTPLYSIHISPYEKMLVCAPQKRLSVVQDAPTCTAHNATLPSHLVVVDKNGFAEVAYRRGTSSSHTLSAQSTSPLLLARAHTAPKHSSPLDVRLSVPHIQNAFAARELTFSIENPAPILHAARRTAHAALRIPRSLPACLVTVASWRCEASARVLVPLRLRGSVAFFADDAAPDASPVKVPIEIIVGSDDAAVMWPMQLRSSEEWEGRPRVVCDPASKETAS